VGAAAGPAGVPPEKERIRPMGAGSRGGLACWRHLARVCWWAAVAAEPGPAC